MGIALAASAVFLAIFVLPIALAIWTARKTSRFLNQINDLQSRLRHLEEDLRLLKKQAPPGSPTATPVPLQPAPEPESRPIPPVIMERPQPPPLPQPSPASPGQRGPAPPRIESSQETFPKETVPRPAINWERFMGAKLFAWLGGFALFLGVAFFVKYSFENNLISPEIRVALGFFTGISLLAGGVLMSRKEYQTTSWTLCATGTVILYAVIFACHSFYRLIESPALTFLLMTLVTATAFLLAVRLKGQVIAILGLLGGFLTPPLISTGQDNPLGFFGYIAILDVGLLAVAWRRRWDHLALMAAMGTVVMQVGWTVKFFAVSKVLTAMAVFLGFEALFLLAFFWNRRTGQSNHYMAGSAILMAFGALVFTLFLMSFRDLGLQPDKLFPYILLADLGVLALAFAQDALRKALVIAGAIVFVILGIWTENYLSNALLNWALGFYLVFAVLHSVAPVVLQQRHPSTTPLWWINLFPVFALLLIILHITQNEAVSSLVWIGVLLLDLVVIGIAMFTASVFSLAAMLVLTLGAAALWISKVPVQLTGLPELLTVIGGFAIFFFVAGIFVWRKIAPRARSVGGTLGAPSRISDDVRVQIPALSAILPFLLLIMVVARLPMSNPSPVFGLALLLVVLLLGVTRLSNIDWLSAVGLACVLALEWTWYRIHFKHDNAFLPLSWFLIFFAVFALFPFVCRVARDSRILLWTVAALSGPLHFHLIYTLVSKAYPNASMGLLPAAFAAPFAFGLAHMARRLPVENPKRNTQLALFGGVTLFFITLIFPIQFERQWITIGWALEGTALLWLFHRVPHPGLRLAGFVLLMAAFVRLALNPAVLSYHPRSATPILNWYLYSYGIVTVCLMAGARLLSPPRNMIRGSDARAVLYGLGVALAFLLMNIEIADYFSEGTTLTFQFKGNFARDMTYSIAWALFALGLLIAGIHKKIPAARYASIFLLSVTLLKLFFHDLSRLGQLYRIGALIVVAIIAMIASFLYQRFLVTNTEKK